MKRVAKAGADKPKMRKPDFPITRIINNASVHVAGFILLAAVLTGCQNGSGLDNDREKIEERRQEYIQQRQQEFDQG